MTELVLTKWKCLTLSLLHTGRRLQAKFPNPWDGIEKNLLQASLFQHMTLTWGPPRPTLLLSELSLSKMSPSLWKPMVTRETVSCTQGPSIVMCLIITRSISNYIPTHR